MSSLNKRNNVNIFHSIPTWKSKGYFNTDTRNACKDCGASKIQWFNEFIYQSSTKLVWIYKGANRFR